MKTLNTAKSVFSGIAQYLSQVLRGGKSVVRSCLTIIPYFFRVGELRKEITEGYPDPVSSKGADDLPPRSRGLLFNDIDRCTGCADCSAVCPANCIRIEGEPTSDDSKIWVGTFDIDYSKCMFCGLCVEACLPMSLVHTRQFEGAAYRLNDLVTSFGRGQLTSEQRAKWAELRQMNSTEVALEE